MSLSMMPHAMRILPPDSCPHCGSEADTVRDEWGLAHCRDCGRARDCVLDQVARDRAAYRGGPQETS